MQWHIVLKEALKAAVVSGLTTLGALFALPPELAHTVAVNLGGALLRLLGL